MVTGPEARILARLVTFPPSLESAWDVPRDICLPGLAEYLGVVRSALHTPLNELIKKELITERKAHVIGGGTRKRKVYHITKLGRAECQEISIPEKKKVGELLGKPPSPTFLHGRDQLIGELKDIKKLIITGLPGIGKTSLLRKIADELVSEGKTVRYATAESFKDIVEIFAEWELKFSSENAVLNETKNEVLILDELQEISQRHLGRLEIFASKVQHLVMASRAPLPISEGFEVVEIPPLEISDAIKLLPTHLDNRKLVAERLGGHPLALQMHDENTAMPEAGTDLQNWVEQVVLSGLGEEIVALDELSLLPVPVPAELLNHQDYLFDLDDHALLRWFENGVELHHLVRNVRSTMLTSEHHQEAAKYWSKIEGDLARLVEIHHALNSDGDVESLLIKNAESLMVRSSAGLATLIGDALFRTPSQNLSRIAAMVAIERGEAEIASKYLHDCDAPDLEFSLAILMGESDVEIPKDADFRLLLSEASRRLDDRLPDEDGSEEVLELLNQIDVSSADKELRKVILVAIAHIRHAWFISTKNWSKAAEIRTNLESLTHQNDSQLEAMRLRSEIAQTPSNSASFDKLIETAFSKSGLRAKMLQVSLVQRCEESRAKSILNRIELPSIDSQKNLTSARRIAATIWYLRALYKTHNSLSSMAEAISLWKLSLCPKAASNATEMMHKLL